MKQQHVLKFIVIAILCNLLQSCVPNEQETEQIKFSIWKVGSSNINDRFNTNTNIYKVLRYLRTETGHLDEFLFTIAEEPLKKEEIIKRSKLSQSQVEYIIASLDSSNFIKKQKDNKWATVVPVITDRQMKVIRKDLSPMAENVAFFLEEEEYKIQELYNAVKAPEDPSWDKVAHLIMDKFIIDGSFHTNLNRLKSENNTDGKHESLLPVFMLQRGQHFANYGCNWYKFQKKGEQREVYVLHGAVLNRYDIRMNKYNHDSLFVEGLFSVTPEGAIDSLTSGELSIFNDLGWISEGSLQVPVIKAGTIKCLQPYMAEIGEKAAEVAFQEISDLTASFNRSSYASFIEYEEDYIQVLIHSVFGITIEKLIQNGTVPEIPNPVPEYAGVFIIDGKLY